LYEIDVIISAECYLFDVATNIKTSPIKIDLEFTLRKKYKSALEFNFQPKSITLACKSKKIQERV